MRRHVLTCYFLVSRILPFTFDLRVMSLKESLGNSLGLFYHRFCYYYYVQFTILYVFMILLYPPMDRTTSLLTSKTQGHFTTFLPIDFHSPFNKIVRHLLAPSNCVSVDSTDYPQTPRCKQHKGEPSRPMSKDTTGSKKYLL